MIFKCISIKNLDFPKSRYISFSNLNLNTSFSSRLTLKDNEINRPKETREKSVIIQTHSKCSDIEKINNESYLVNREEIKISFFLYQSLKLISNSIIIYTFNMVQANLLKERFKAETNLKIIVLNENCSNFEKADYIIINYIDSPISEGSKNESPSFNSTLNSKKYYNEEFFNEILENYAQSMLYIISNDEYLDENGSLSINNTSYNSSECNKINIKSKIKKYKEIQVPYISRDIVSDEYNVCFIIDNTGSMSSMIDGIKGICHNLFVEIVKQFAKYRFYFGCVFYADEPSCPSDKNFKIDFTNNESEFKSQLEAIKGQDGDDVAEDWVGGFQMALDELNWGNGTKLIIHIADAPQHGKIFNTDKIYDNFLNEENDIHGQNLIKLIKNLSERNIKITGVSINNVCSFKVFKEEYEKVIGPQYEIIEVKDNELIGGNDSVLKEKLLDIITKSINVNKSENILK